MIVASLDLTKHRNEYFTSVFTVEDSTTKPSPRVLFTGSEEDKLKDIKIDEDMVKKKIDCIRTDKAAGVDGFSPRVLFELKDERMNYAVH